MKTKAAAVVILAAALLFSGCGSQSGADKAIAAADKAIAGCKLWGNDKVSLATKKESLKLFAAAAHLDPVAYFNLSAAVMDTWFALNNPNRVLDIDRPGYIFFSDFCFDTWESQQ